MSIMMKKEIFSSSMLANMLKAISEPCLKLLQSALMKKQEKSPALLFLFLKIAQKNFIL